MKQNTASQRVVAELRARIRSGALRPGQPVPSAREIVREWNVAIATAHKALATLRKEGLVRVEPGIGTIVRGDRGERGLELSRQRIVQAAIAIADDEGTAALSMRLVARELGVSTMALYRHVASKDELLVLMADSVLGESPPPRRSARGWRHRLEQLARLEWAGYRRHPWLAQLLSMTRPQLAPNGMRHTEAVLEALSELRWDAATTLYTGITFLAFVRGMAVGIEAEQQAEQDSGLSSDDWMRQEEHTFAAVMPRFPTLARLTQDVDVNVTVDALFERGLSLMLDGLERKKR
jgi:AcrR family transcriptional regulator